MADQRRRAGHAEAGQARHRYGAQGEDPRRVQREHHLRQAGQAGGQGNRRTLRRRPLRRQPERRRTGRCRPISSCSRSPCRPSPRASARERHARPRPDAVARPRLGARRVDLGARRDGAPIPTARRRCGTPPSSWGRAPSAASSASTARASRRCSRRSWASSRPSAGEIRICRADAARGAEAQPRRLRAAVGGRRLELPRAGRRRRHDGPLRPHGLPAHALRRSTGARSTRRWSASA